MKKNMKSVTINYTTWGIGFLAIFLIFLCWISLPIGLLGLGITVLAFAAKHRKNKRKSNWQKHSKKRAGQTYGQGQNQKKGTKNKKYQPPVNPNKKGNQKSKKNDDLDKKTTDNQENPENKNE